MSKTTKNKKQALVPRLRFPEFRDDTEWEGKPLGNCLDYLQPTKYLVSSTAYNDAYETPVLTAGKTFILGYANEKNGIFKKNLPVIIFDDFTTASKFVDFPFKAKSSAMKILLARRNANIKFVYESMQMLRYEVGVHERHWISIFSKLNIPLPPTYDEQQKIADCLSSLDALIAAQSEKIDTFKTHKKGLMQQLFPREGETVPRLRFPVFRVNMQWEKKPLGNYLDYLQPTKYLVSSTAYNDAYETPVLTAGKTFMLGHTNEKNGIFKKNLPVIIFDDFTTASKFVDFPFKAKSSAMKILLAKRNANIKFLYESMQLLRYEVGVHKRHWISIFSKLDIPLPPTYDEQQKIADCLSSLDALIAAQTERIDALKTHKKGLMQQLFPNPELRKA